MSQFFASPRIKHLAVDRSIGLVDFVSEQLQFSQERVQELLRVGALYVDKNRTTQDFLLNAGQYVRVHFEPRRYPVERINWLKRVVYENENFVIFNKPWGIPVHPSVDNSLENVITQLGLKLNQTLHTTQRLDVVTRGLFLTAKTKEFQAAYNKQLSGRAIEKEYWVLTENEPALGLQVHYMKPSRRAPREISQALYEGWARCELEVLRCLPWRPQSTAETQKFYYLSMVKLLTGRTHQIRVQFQAMGNPVFGDTDYGGSSIQAVLGVGLCSRRLAFTCPMTHKKFEFVLDSPEFEDLFTKVSACSD